MALWTLALCNFAAMAYPQDPSAITLIKQTINTFPVVVDNQLLDQFDQVFTQNATANLHPPNNQIFYGIPEIVKSISGLANVSSQHGFTTQLINLLSPTTANGTIYLFANFYGKGPQLGQVFTAYGVYQTLLSLTPSGWRIYYMDLNLIHTTGNISIAFPDRVTS